MCFFRFLRLKKKCSSWETSNPHFNHRPVLIIDPGQNYQCSSKLLTGISSTVRSKASFFKERTKTFLFNCYCLRHSLIKQCRWKNKVITERQFIISEEPGVTNLLEKKVTPAHQIQIVIILRSIDYYKYVVILN